MIDYSAEVAVGEVGGCERIKFSTMLKNPSVDG